SRGRSPKTIRDNYGYALKGVFLPWCAGGGITQPAQITSRGLDCFSSDLLERAGKRGPLSRVSVAPFAGSVHWWRCWSRTPADLATGRMPPCFRISCWRSRFRRCCLPRTKPPLRRAPTKGSARVGKGPLEMLCQNHGPLQFEIDR